MSARSKAAALSFGIVPPVPLTFREAGHHRLEGFRREQTEKWRFQLFLLPHRGSYVFTLVKKNRVIVLKIIWNVEICHFWHFMRGAGSRYYTILKFSQNGRGKSTFSSIYSGFINNLFYQSSHSKFKPSASKIFTDVLFFYMVFWYIL